MALALELSILAVGALGAVLLWTVLEGSRVRRGLKPSARLAVDVATIGAPWVAYVIGLVPPVLGDGAVLTALLTMAGWVGLHLVVGWAGLPDDAPSLSGATLVGEHYRPTDAAHPPGVYRVVGAMDRVALLRVTDHRDRRVHSGALRHVTPDALADGFEPVGDPDAGVHPIAAIRNALQGLYWTLRGRRF